MWQENLERVLDKIMKQSDKQDRRINNLCEDGTSPLRSNFKDVNLRESRYVVTSPTMEAGQSAS